MPLVDEHKIVIEAPASLVKSSYELIQRVLDQFDIGPGKPPATPEQQQAIQATLDKLCDLENHWPIKLEWRE